jgi:hypothetical protein
MGRSSLAILPPIRFRASRILSVRPIFRSVPLTGFATSLSRRLSARDGTVAELGSDGGEGCRKAGLLGSCCLHWANITWLPPSWVERGTR